MNCAIHSITNNSSVHRVTYASCFKGNISNVYCNLNMYSMIDTVLTIYRHDNETITNGNISNMYNSNMYAT